MTMLRKVALAMLECDRQYGHADEDCTVESYLMSAHAAMDTARVGEMIAALKRVRMHADLIRLAPERRFVIGLLDGLLAKVTDQK